MTPSDYETSSLTTRPRRHNQKVEFGTISNTRKPLCIYSCYSPLPVPLQGPYGSYVMSLGTSAPTKPLRGFRLSHWVRVPLQAPSGHHVRTLELAALTLTDNNRIPFDSQTPIESLSIAKPPENFSRIGKKSMLDLRIVYITFRSKHGGTNLA